MNTDEHRFWIAAIDREPKGGSSQAREPISYLPLSGKIKVPRFMWFLYGICVPFAIVWSIAWVVLFIIPSSSVRFWLNIAMWLIPLGGLFGLITGIIGLVKATRIEIQENGICRSTKSGISLFKWEDVTRCEGFRTSFTLFFKNGERIELPGCIENLSDVRNYCLQKLEQIGTFEDGSKVPRYVFSISHKSGILLLVIIVALIAILIKLAYAHL